MTTTRFHAPDIQCGGCAGAIQRTLTPVAGIAQVAVDVDTKTVTVDHDAELVTVENVLTRLDHAGFPATVAQS